MDQRWGDIGAELRGWALVTVTAMVTATGALAQGAVAFDGAWKTQRFSLFSANSYVFNGSSVTLASDGAVSLAYRPLPESFWTARKASWQWQVSQSVPATDLTQKGGDDRNLALYFVFLPEAEAARLGGSSVRRLLGHDDARVLVYVWGGDHPRGAILSSPYLGARGKTIVLRGAGTGAAREEVQLDRDLSRAFGQSALALVGLAVSGDSDDTDSRIRGRLGELVLR